MTCDKEAELPAEFRAVRSSQHDVPSASSEVRGHATSARLHLQGRAVDSPAMSHLPRLLRFTRSVLLSASGCWVSAVFAVDAIRPPGNRPQPASVHALVGGRVVVKPGQELERGTIVLRDGRIVAVGAEVAVPTDARVHDMAGTTIYAGFIDAHVVFSKGSGERAAVVDGESAVDASQDRYSICPDQDRRIHPIQKHQGHS